MSALRCRVGWHLWTRWSDPAARQYVVKAYRMYGIPVALDHPIETTVWEQRRACLRCGTAETRKVSE